MKQKKSSAKHRALLGQVSDMDLRLLQVFRHVVECGGMAAAELELNIGISTISRHVKDLETRLGLVLCRRGRAGFALTPEGQQVYDATLHVMGAIDAFRDSVDDIHHRMGGVLQVALFDKTITNPQARIGQAIAHFTRLAPEVHLNLHVAPINMVERGLMDGTFQIGVVPAHRHSPSLAYAPLFTERMHLYCGRGHPLYGGVHDQLDWAALRQHAYAGLGYHSPNMEASHAARLQRRATGFDQEAIVALLLSGQFIAFLPTHYAAAFEQSGLIQAIRPAHFHYSCPFLGALRRSPAPSRAAKAFFDCLVQAHAGTAPANR